MRCLLISFLAFTLSLPAVAQDYAEAVAAYESGDHATALKEWRRLAEEGDARAEFALGQMYNFGIGVRQDDDRAFVWYRRAAEGGHPRAEAALGFRYAYGVGTSRDDVQAYVWFSRAASRGNSLAEAYRDRLWPKLSDAQRTEAERLLAEPVRTAKAEPTAPEPQAPARVAADILDSYRIQLGAFSKAERAPAYWEQLRASEADLLGRFKPYIQVAERGARRLHLLQAGPLGDAKSARALCASLATREIDCMVVKRAE